jgi:hypothetical protein
MGEEEKYLNYPLFDSIISRLFFFNYLILIGPIMVSAIYYQWSSSAIGESTKEQAIKGVMVSGVSFLINNFIFPCPFFFLSFVRAFHYGHPMILPVLENSALETRIMNIERLGR